MYAYVMKRQRGKFLWDLHWENKTYMLKRSIAASLYATSYFCARALVCADFSLMHASQCPHLSRLNISFLRRIELIFNYQDRRVTHLSKYTVNCFSSIRHDETFVVIYEWLCEVTLSRQRTELMAEAVCSDHNEILIYWKMIFFYIQE